MQETPSDLGQGGIFQIFGDSTPVPGWLLQVPPDLNGMRVDAFVCARVPRLSRSRASRLRLFDYESGRILKKSALVTPGQQVLAIRPTPDEDAEVVHQPRIVWQNEQWCLLDKPPMMATHPSASYFKRTVAYWLRCQGFKHMQSVHRLDVETSGLLLCGKTIEAVRLGSDAFAAHEVRKDYLAVLDTRVPTDMDTWRVDTPLGFDSTSTVPIKMGVGNLSATTHFQVLKRGAHRTLVQASPKGGRQHQIRVHAQLCGMPLVGDKLYGPDERFFLNRRQPLIESDLEALGHWRHALHAHRLCASFLPQTFEIPSPEDWSEIRGIRDYAPDLKGN
jgi:23S rRNA pseudouridine1911/1915/1917 synthase